MIYMKTSGTVPCGCFFFFKKKHTFIESEKMKTVGVNRSFRRFSHGERETHCTMARVQSRVKGGFFF